MPNGEVRSARGGDHPVDRARCCDPRLLSGRNGGSASASSRASSDLPKGTVHGILRTLAAVGFVEQDEETGKYQLGAALLHMGSQYLDGNELRTRALNWSDSLAARAAKASASGPCTTRRCSSCTTCSGPTTAASARGRHAAAGARDGHGQGPAGGEPLRRGRAGARRAARLTPATVTDWDVLARKLAGRARARLGRRRRGARGRRSSRSRRRSRTAAASPSARSASPGRSSG